MNTVTISTREIQPIKMLVTAIVEKACADWFLAKNLLGDKHHYADGVKLLNDVETFFRNEYGKYAIVGLSGEEILNELELQWERGKRDWKSDEYN